MHLRPTALLLLTALLALGAAAASADVLTTTEGLVLEGQVERLADGSYRVTTESGSLEVAAASVASVRTGVSPRAAWRAKVEATEAGDVVALYRLALEIEGEGLDDLAREVYERVLKLEPDHPAARRTLGFERHDGAWITAEAARRKKGLVLYRGRWMLPAELEAVAVATPDLPAAEDLARATDLLRTLATGAAPLQRAARVAMARTDGALLLQAALAALYDADPKVRIVSARGLAELGDESALRPLIFSGARDTDSAVRREAVLAAQSFGHDDTAVPFVRALGSKNLRLVANAAEALALLGDQRAAAYIVKRLHSHGSSTRNFVAFINQVSYVRDYDVEIAQASNIANPDIAVIQEGVVLDVRVLDAAITQTWIEPILVKAFSSLVGQELPSAGAAAEWYEEHAGSLPSFPPKPGSRAPRRLPKGRVLGVPQH